MKTLREIECWQELLLQSSPTQRSVPSFAVRVFLWWRPSFLLRTLLWHLKTMLLPLLPSPLWAVQGVMCNRVPFVATACFC